MTNKKEELASASSTSVRALPPSKFNEIPSTLSLSSPIADISRGWDGTLWAVDKSGAPHFYDPLQKVWTPYGTGIDAAAMVGDQYYHFRGPEYINFVFAITENAAPTLIGQTWPELPKSFQLGVRGAAFVSGKLYLFGRGQYVSVDAPTQVFHLDQMAGWPATGGWAGGAIDGSFSTGSDQVLLFRNGEYITVSVGQHRVMTAPLPLSEYPGFQAVPAGFLSQGFNGGFSIGNGDMCLYNGPAVMFPGADSGSSNPVYLASAYSCWPPTWNPTLAHAPSGRIGHLWSAMDNGRGVMYHDGDAWNALDGVASYASVGFDCSVYTIGDNFAVYQWQGANNWTQIASAPDATPLAQISVASAGSIWALSYGNTVHVLTSGAFVPSSEIGQATHLAANFDGTVWHCNNDSNAYRFAAGTSASDPLPVPQGMVQKIASTGFGTSHCLAALPDSNQVYEYTSPFLYKTVPAYEIPAYAGGQIAEGLGRIFFINEVGLSDPNNPDFQSSLVAADAQTGQKIWETAAPWKNCHSTAPVFDARLNLVYFGLSVADQSDTTNPGLIVAVNAVTGAIAWMIQDRGPQHPGIFPSVDFTPALSGSTLCFGDRLGYIHVIDTGSALRNNGGSATWSIQGYVGSGQLRVSTPAIVDNICYFYTYSSGDSAFYVQSCVAADGSSLTVPPWRKLDVPTGEDPDLWPPVFGKGVFSGADALFIQACNEVHAVNLGAAPTSDNDGGLDDDLGFSLGSGVTFTTNLSYVNQTLWLGDSAGNIHALDSAFQHVNKTPQQISLPGRKLMSVTAYADNSGSTTVFCAAYIADGTEPGSLFAFDPANDVVEVIPTGFSEVWSLGSVNSNGVLPAAGGISATTHGGPIFGIRVDQIVSSLRSFVIESQLLQDYDEGAPGSNPTAAARYQTHVTVLNNFKGPRRDEAIKIWADTADTVIQVDGTSYTIGPDDSSCATLQTAIDGTITILSDASDLSAASLRLWAGFMDPYERILVCPDQEFHGRLMTAHADPNDSDPSKINLTTAQTYTQWKPDGQGGTSPVSTTPLLTGNQPTQVATSIQKFGGASGVGQSPVSAIRYHAFGAAAPKYAAYDDLVGQGYSPVNVALKRLVTVGLPAGFTFSTQSGFSECSPAQAAAAIDALVGNEWQPRGFMLGSQQLVGGWWGSFWDWVKDEVTKAAEAVASVAVSIAEDIYVGIQVIVDGVATLFRAIVHTIEDAVKAIGAFFLKIGKLIENVIQALSVLFHFDEILKVHNMMRDTINSRLTGSANFLDTKVLAAVNNFFGRAEHDVEQGFCNWKQSMGMSCATSLGDSGTSLMSLNGAGSTPHTIFSVAPKTGGAKKSHSVQAMWGINKMKSNSKNINVKGSQSLADAEDPITAFAEGFMQSLTTNTTLQQAYSQTSQDFKQKFNFSSPDQFFGGLLDTLIDIIEDIVLSGLALSQAMLVGIVKAAVAMIQDVQEGLNYQIDIPLLSSLYTMLTGNPLTLLDLGCLILAIPVTLVYRIIDGNYPGTAIALGSYGVDLVVQRVMGLVNGICYVPYGILSMFADLWSGTLDDIPSIPAIGYVANGLGTVMWVCQYPNWVQDSGDSAPDQDIVAWAVGAQTPLFARLQAKPGSSAAALPILYCVGALGSIAAYIVQKAEDGSSEDTIAFIGNLFSTLPNLAAPLLLPTLSQETLGVTLAIKLMVDVIGNFGAAGCILVDTVINWNPATMLEPQAALA